MNVRIVTKQTTITQIQQIIVAVIPPSLRGCLEYNELRKINLLYLSIFLRRELECCSQASSLVVAGKTGIHGKCAGIRGQR